MKFFNTLATLGATAALLGTTAFADDSKKGSSDSKTPSIEVVGNKFFFSNNGSQFYIKGVAYQSDISNGTSEKSFNDPLADPDACKRDVKYLQDLGTNVIRTYAINTSKDHSDCLKTFADAGIYIISDLSEPGLSIDRDDPKWNVELMNRYTSVAKLLAKQDNVLGFFVGNEVTNNKTNTGASAFVKAAARDLRKWMKNEGLRDVPIGYSSNDDSDTRKDLADYFACGSKDDGRIDFLGVNNYEWCGDSSFQKSGYEERTKEYEKLGVPVFFSEYGCNAKQPRKFTEVGTIYSDKMTDVWSGGIVYMYFEEENNYGLVSVKDDKVSTLKDYSYLSKELKSISPSSAKSSDVKKTASTVSCPKSNSDWAANTKLPPTPNQGVCDCISEASNCLVAKDVKSDDYGKLFGYLCGKLNCDGINGNGTKGTYGAYSFCDAKDQLNFLLNMYYEKNGKKSSACDFSGSATVNDSPKTKGQCKSVLSEAGTAGTQEVTASATGSYKGGAEAKDTASGGGGAQGSGSSSSGKSGAGSVRGDTMVMASFAFGAFGVGLALIL